MYSIIYLKRIILMLPTTIAYKNIIITTTYISYGTYAFVVLCLIL